MPSRMIHYFVAEEVSKQVSITDKNRFKIGSLCPDMSIREDDSKERTHYVEYVGKKKGINWKRFVDLYGDKMKEDDLYLGVLCHLITDGVWFYEIMEPRIRSKVKGKEERTKKFIEGYGDFHKLNYILREEFQLVWELEEDRNIELDGLHAELYEEVFGGLYRDFFEEPVAKKEELSIYPYEMSVECLKLCVNECIRAINNFRKKEDVQAPEKYYVPLREE